MMQYREQPCRRVIAGGLPDTAGQPTRVQLHMTLDQLRDLPGAADAERAWAAARAAAGGTPYAADILSGPAGLAAFLRTGLLAGDFAATASLPLDTGTSTATVPPHLRRAVILRDRHCAFPGCRQAPAACQVHHLIPRAKGGKTALTNLALLCTFHHLIAVHRWGWTLTLHADGTTTATSPDGRKVFHSHGPPGKATA
jgi:HNH endonuclease